MRFPCLLFCLLFAVSPEGRAEWTELPWPALGASLPIWRPDGFNPSEKHPAIVYYHGTGGEPNVAFIHQATGGRSFVLVGMTYRHKGRFSYSDEEIADELGLLNALKKTLVGSLSVDPQRIYVGGFSRGGWHSAMLLDYDRELAGGLILGAGIFRERSGAVKFGQPVPIYIGCGRFDGNYPAAIAALVSFRKLGAGPVLEAWPQTAHAFPETPPEGMRQWLRIEAGEHGLENEAVEWMAARVVEIDGMESQVAQWLAYDEFVTLPFVKRFGEESAKAAGGLIVSLLKNPTVANGKKWRDESRKILVRESRDRLVSTLQSASRAHHALAQDAVGTVAGAEA